MVDYPLPVTACLNYYLHYFSHFWNESPYLSITLSIILARSEKLLMPGLHILGPFLEGGCEVNFVVYVPAGRHRGSVGRLTPTGDRRVGRARGGSVGRATPTGGRRAG